MKKLDQIVEILKTRCSDYKIDQFYESEAKFIAKSVPGVTVASGVSRICFLADDDDTRVIKVPYADGYNDRCIDYCAREIELYAKAQKMGIEKLLLPNSVVCVLDSGLTIYSQPRYSFSDRHAPDDFMEAVENKTANLHRKKIMQDIFNGLYDNYRYDTYGIWLKRATQLYGKRFMRSFEKWTKDNRVGDIHGKNRGWLHGRPILLDYGGYEG